MGRDVPFSEEEYCDVCGTKGVYDFMGDLLCPKCMGDEDEEETTEELANRLVKILSDRKDKKEIINKLIIKTNYNACTCDKCTDTKV